MVFAKKPRGEPGQHRRHKQREPECASKLAKQESRPQPASESSGANQADGDEKVDEFSRLQASTLEWIKAEQKAASHTMKTSKNAAARMKSFVCQIRIRSAGWASIMEKVFRLASRPIVVNAMIVKPKKSREAT